MTNKVDRASTRSQPADLSRMAGRGLALVLVATYCVHLPLYRLAEVSARDVADFDRSTLADSVG
jgi:transposase